MSRKTKKKIHGLAGDLVCHVLGFKKEDDDGFFEETVNFCIENFDTHQFPDTEWKKTKRGLEGLVTKFSIHNDISRAEALDGAFKSYLTTIPSVHSDEGYDIIRLLQLLSSTRKPDLVVSGAGKGKGKKKAKRDWMDLAALNPKQRAVIKLTSRLIHKTIGFKPKDEHFPPTLNYCVESFHNHSFLEAQKADVRRLCAGFFKRLKQINVEKAMKFKGLFKAYEESLPVGASNEAYYKIIHTLLSVAGSSRTEREDARSARSPLKLMQRIEAREMTYDEIVDDSCKQLEAEWLEEYEESIAERQNVFAEELAGAVNALLEQGEGDQSDTDTQSGDDNDEQQLDEEEMDLGGPSVLAQAMVEVLKQEAQASRASSSKNKQDKQASGEGFGFEGLFDASEPSLETFDTKFDTLGVQAKINRLVTSTQKRQQHVAQIAFDPAPKKSWNTLHMKLQDFVRNSVQSAPQSDSLYLATPKLTLERVLVKHCTNVLRGITGTVFELDPNSSCYTCRRDVATASLSSQALHNLLLAFATRASQRYSITQFIQRHGSTSPDTSSRCFQAFAGALATRLDSLELCLVKFEIAVQNPTSKVPVTLLSLWQWVSRELESLSFLFSLVHYVTEHAPTAHSMLSGLYRAFNNYSVLGDPQKTGTVLFLFVHTLMPYIQMLDKWIREGVIEDPFGEFMIYESSVHLRHSSEYWSEGFTIRCEENPNSSDGATTPCVPDFLLPFAKRILLTGKSLHMCELIDVHCAAKQQQLAKQPLEQLFWNSVARIAAECSGVSARLSLSSPAFKPRAGSLCGLEGTEEDREAVSVAESLRSMSAIGEGGESSTYDDSLHLIDSMTTAIQVRASKTSTTNLTFKPRAYDMSQLECFVDGVDFIPSGFQLLPPALFSHLCTSYDRASRNLKELLAEKCCMLDHLMALRETFLLANQEIARDLSAALVEQFDHWTGNVRAIEEAVQDSLRSSPLCDVQLADQVTVKVDTNKLNASIGKGGSVNRVTAMESITFNVQVRWPLNMIVDDQAVSLYNQTLTLLLQVLQARQALEGMFFFAKTHKRRFDSVTFELLLFKSQVYHFVSNLHSYVMFRAVDGVWHDFRQCLDDSVTSDFDELRRLHFKYLTDIQNLLFVQTPHAMVAIKKVLALCVDLRRLTDDFLSQCTPAEGAPPLTEEKADTHYKMALMSLNRRLGPLKREFQNNLRWLLVMLTKIVEGGFHPHLEDVLTRLNFNLHYSLS